MSSVYNKAFLKLFIYYNLFTDSLWSIGKEARAILNQVIKDEEIQMADCTTLLNGSRHPPFIKICLEILKQHDYKVTVNL